MMTTLLLAVHLVSADPAPQLLVEATDPKLTTDFNILDLRGKALLAIPPAEGDGLEPVDAVDR